ncbi:MAG: rhodanese-like domain-containing protein [Candidatus Hodarchaeales archaeon]
MKNNDQIEIKPYELLDKLRCKEDISLIDVRDGDSFNDWHIFDSINHPLFNLLKSKGKDLKKYRNKNIVTICTRGVDSLVAAKELKNLGFNVQSLAVRLTA